MSLTAPMNSGKQVICKKCKSNQIVSNKRGYSFKRMFLVTLLLFVIGIIFLSLSFSLNYYSRDLFYIFYVPSFLSFLALPIGIITGFFGRSNLVNGCMNCGHKWMPGR